MQDKLKDSIQEKKYEYQAYEIQKAADRNDFRPAYKFTKMIRGKIERKKDDVLIANNEGKQAQNIE